LKKPTMAAVTAVETHRVSGQQPPHNRGDGNVPGSQEKMEMVGYQGPGETARFTFADNSRQSVNKIITIVICKKKLPPFYPTADDMVQRSGRVDSCFSRYSIYISYPDWFRTA
jgi:hypothetical protein